MNKTFVLIKNMRSDIMDDYQEFKNKMDVSLPNLIHNDDVFFVCIGTDRSTGDSLAPLVGTKLRSLGYDNVVGTIDDPVHGVNLQDVLGGLPKDKTIIAIDACLGRHSNVGKLNFNVGSLKPGAGVGKDLPQVGDYHITGIVNIGGFMEYFVLQNTRLSMVMKMANQIVDAITEKFPTIQNTYKQAAITSENIKFEIVEYWRKATYVAI